MGLDLGVCHTKEVSQKEKQISYTKVESAVRLNEPISWVGIDTDMAMDTIGREGKWDELRVALIYIQYHV